MTLGEFIWLIINKSGSKNQTKGGYCYEEVLYFFKSKGMIFAVLVALGVMIGWIAYATIPDSNGVIHACYTKSTGSLRVIDSSVTSCKSGEIALTWNVQGPQGPQGPSGPAGSPDTADQVRDKFFSGTSCGDPNMVKVGPICVDKYEASVWSMPPDANGNPQGTQFGASSDNYPCSANGNNCSSGSTKIFAASVAGVTPSASITWFQAQQACANVGKRLLRFHGEPSIVSTT